MHGSPYDRGGADYYYRREYNPHYWPEGTYKGRRIGAEEMTEEEHLEYRAGWKEAEEFGEQKEW